MVAEKTDEWGQEIWLAALDLEKAFDKVLHSSVFETLVQAGADPAIITVLSRLYAQQQAYVR